MAKAKKKAKKTDEPTPAQKAAATKRRQKLEAQQAKLTETTKPDKPSIEKPAVKVTPYPRAGDNPAFEDVMNRARQEKESTPPKENRKTVGITEPAKPAIGEEILTVADVAEWVAWPFLLWAQTNEMPALILSPKDATSISEPLTTILNRHGASRYLPPDIIDGLKVGARATPVMGDRLAAIKRERVRRAAAGGGGDTHNPTPFVRPGAKGPQGAAPIKPKEV